MFRRKTGLPLNAGVLALAQIRIFLFSGLVALQPAFSAPAAAAEQRLWQVSSQKYTLPGLKLLGADGQARPLAKALDDGRPTVLTFMYSSCVTVCPIVSQTLVQFEQLLGPSRAKVNTVSISIDPTHDTVQKLAQHAKSTGASGSFYTSDPAVSEAVQRAFNVWRGGDKMNHQAVFLIKPAGAAAWVRVDGLITPAELLKIYQGAMATKSL